MNDSPTFRFNGRAVGQDPTGYYYARWDRAEPISVLAKSRQEATNKAFAMLGTHPRFGTSGFGDGRDTPGWGLRWDSAEEVAT